MSLLCFLKKILLLADFSIYITLTPDGARLAILKVVHATSTPLIPIQTKVHTLV